MTTPDTYPLSLNSLIAACNQRSSREPVMDLSEDQVRGGLEELEVESLVNEARENGRVTKYEHRIRTVLNLRRDETAVICLLTLRGPQTPGELRSRSDRMFQFDDLAQVQSTLEAYGWPRAAAGNAACAAAWIARGSLGAPAGWAGGESCRAPDRANCDGTRFGRVGVSPRAV